MEELKTLQKNYDEILKQFLNDFEKFQKKNLNDLNDFWRFFGKFLVLENIAEIFRKFF